MAKSQKKQFRITLGPSVAAFSYVHKPDTGGKFSDDKYKLTMPLDADDPKIKEHEKVCKEAAKEKWGKVPKNLQLPFPEKGGEEFEGKVCPTPKSKFEPSVVDAKREELPDGVLVKAGDLVKASCGLYCYEKTEKVKVKEGGKTKTVNETVHGVSLQLRAIQLLEKRSGGKANAKDEFDDEDDYEGLADATADDDAADNDDFDDDDEGGNDDPDDF